MRSVSPEVFLLAALALCLALPIAAEFDYSLELALERQRLDGLTLGDDPPEDRLEEDSIEVELELEYGIGDDLYLFYTGAVFAETETIESAGTDTRDNGIEHRQVGVGLFFGDALQGRLRLGRVEISEDDAWWLWIDDEIDALDLELAWQDIEGRMLISEAQASRGSAESRIDPELDDVRYAMAMLDWEFASGHRFVIDWLQQRDHSPIAAVGESFDARREDEVDADLDWIGLRYRGLFEIDAFAEIAVELVRAEVDGDEWRIESEDAGGGRLEVEERVRGDVSSSASAWRLDIRPAALPDWRLRFAALSGDGDINEDDGVDHAWRQTGIHGDNEIYGELYQPAPGNLALSMLGLEWRASERLTVGLAHYDYRKQRSAGEAPDSSIELDADAAGRSLGKELDLSLKAELLDGLDLELTLARFEAGRAYGNPPDDEADYVSLEIDWQF